MPFKSLNISWRQAVGRNFFFASGGWLSPAYSGISETVSCFSRSMRKVGVPPK